MSRRKQTRPLVFQQYEIDGLRNAFPSKDPPIENDLTGKFPNFLFNYESIGNPPHYKKFRE